MPSAVVGALHTASFSFSPNDDWCYMCNKATTFSAECWEVRELQICLPNITEHD